MHAHCLCLTAGGGDLARFARAFSSTVHKGQLQDDAPGIVEIREYVLKPEGFKNWLALTQEHVELRKKLNPHWLGLFTVDTGSCLHKVVHLYAYKDMDHRDQVGADTGIN